MVSSGELDRIEKALLDVTQLKVRIPSMVDVAALKKTPLLKKNIEEKLTKEVRALAAEADAPERWRRAVTQSDAVLLELGNIELWHTGHTFEFKNL